ncbi:MAG: hypothetical protein LBQ12_11190 [Deltaproteobacteria bacterium]|jgi:cell division protein FtsZ|nr:hypothetical protein [Deltaproteobacteria bacterium]
MEDDFEFVRPDSEPAAGGPASDSGPSAAGHSISVIGIGGCGNKTVNHMIQTNGVNGIKYVAANSDPQDLKNSLAPTKILLGPKTTRSKGCGGKPERGRIATEEVLDEIRRELAGTELLFIAAGMGGGTGSGGAPVVAQAMGALEEPPLIVSVVTTPFSWEANRWKISDRVVGELTACSNSIITVANSKVETHVPRDSTMIAAYAAANDIILKAVSGIIELLTREGNVNLDFGDLETALSCNGPALMGYGEASGDNRAKKALQNAITCPLMTDHSIKGAKMLIVNMVTSSDFTLDEYISINTEATKEIDPEGQVFTGWAIDESQNESGSIRVTIIATGLYNEEAWTAVDEPEMGPDVVVDLDNIVEETEVTLRPEPEPPRRDLSPHRMAPARPGAAGTSAPAPQYPRALSPQQPGFGVQPQARPALPRDPSAGVLAPPRSPRRQGVYPPPGPGQAKSYEKSSGVDPINQDSKYYETPAFFRNKAS